MGKEGIYKGIMEKVILKICIEIEKIMRTKTETDKERT